MFRPAAPANSTEYRDPAFPYGLLIALAIILIWAVGLGGLLPLSLDQVPRWQIGLAVLWQTFIYTGLFITAHDAMHGSVFPGNPRVNHGVGAVAVFVYALFPYQKLLHKHWQHHRHPARVGDPDFHDGRHKNPVFWYLHFMKGYVSLRQVVVLISTFYIVHWALGVAQNNLYLFWILPAFLSSLQLFVFGTYLPHREPAGGYSNRHRATTYPMPVWVSFLTCYHFGFHEEHHESPHVPWWRLPLAHRQKVYGAAAVRQLPNFDFH